MEYEFFGMETKRAAAGGRYAQWEDFAEQNRLQGKVAFDENRIVRVSGREYPFWNDGYAFVLYDREMEQAVDCSTIVRNEAGEGHIEIRR